MSHVHRVRSTIGASATLAMLLASPAFADDWGTLKGRFKFGGAVPTAAALKADKDVEVCGKEKLLNEELVVGADGGIANVVVFVRVRIFVQIKTVFNHETVKSGRKESPVFRTR